jgi:hypothetical protein
MESQQAVTTVVVPIRYIGSQSPKPDTLLGHRERVWVTGEVIAVPPAEARSYLKHPTLYQPAEAPWSLSEAPVDRSPATVLRLIEREDWDGLRAARPDLVERLLCFLEADPVSRKTVESLDAQDGARLEQYVPALAQVVVQGQANTVFSKLDLLAALLLAYPPLQAAVLEAERVGQGRQPVLRKIESLTHDMLRQMDQPSAAETEQTQDEPA